MVRIGDFRGEAKFSTWLFAIVVNQCGAHYRRCSTTRRLAQGTLLVLTLGLVIDVTNPAALDFVLPGLSAEYGLATSEAALLPLVALTGTTVSSFLWGWLADVYGRRVSILLSTILLVSTAVCGAMPAFVWNLVMCFLMGISAGGIFNVQYGVYNRMSAAGEKPVEAAQRLWGAAADPAHG